MPLSVVTAPPFAGKGRFALSEIQRREAGGELGLVLLDWTRVFTAIVPGAESALRDDGLSDTGASRFGGAAVGFLTNEAIRRELDGYVTVNAPRRALEIADSIPGSVLVEIEFTVEEVASRARSHMTRLARTVARASVGSMRPRCIRGIVTYMQDEHHLVGRARTARPRAGGGYETRGPKREFDRDLWLRGLKPEGRAALRALEASGNEQASPAQVMTYLLRERRKNAS